MIRDKNNHENYYFNTNPQIYKIMKKKKKNPKTHKNSKQVLKELFSLTIKPNTHIFDIFITFVNKGPMTDREVKNQLKLNDMNDSRPYINQLYRKDAVVEAGSKICPETKRNVRLTGINPDKAAELMTQLGIGPNGQVEMFFPDGSVTPAAHQNTERN